MLLKPLVPVLEYACNYDYIASELCENKDNVVMGCNGKCYLMKQLAKESEVEKPLSSDKKHIPTETSDLFVNPLHDFDLAITVSPISAAMHSIYTNFYAHLRTDSCFHPPTFIA
jgi:UDP-N-acetylglucosamine pyrophosphorylase